jgi:hypothetical protein
MVEGTLSRRALTGSSALSKNNHVGESHNHTAYTSGESTVGAAATRTEVPDNGLIASSERRTFDYNACGGKPSLADEQLEPLLRALNITASRAYRACA